jgi:hypothetical protein
VAPYMDVTWPAELQVIPSQAVHKGALTDQLGRTSGGSMVALSSRRFTSSWVTNNFRAGPERHDAHMPA